MGENDNELPAALVDDTKDSDVIFKLIHQLKTEGRISEKEHELLEKAVRRYGTSCMECFAFGSD